MSKKWEIELKKTRSSSNLLTAEDKGWRMVKELDFEAEKKALKSNTSPTLFFCLMAIFLLEMSQNQQLPQNKSEKSQHDISDWTC